ncbi:MAG: asparagine synthase (glutamine-hydrolyzing), partial [Acidobacteriota bacterium]
MCGLCGLFSPDAGGVSGAGASIRRMTRELERRGPDDEAFWVDPEARLRLGFRRLAILDLSPSGRQPMVSSSGDSVLVMNGEIYNFRELRRELEAGGLRFRSTSDTEVALEALELWGLDALGRLEGMFALAFYDLRRRRLTLSRDRTGIKPLWLFEGPAGVAFSSQLDALIHGPWPVDAEPRPDVLHHYLRLGHIPAPLGLLPGTRQLEAGGWRRFDADGRRETGRFWRLPRMSEGALGAEEGVEALDAALERAVARHRLADVPLGVFLSGGVDSPLVGAVARRQTSSELLAFTLGNPGWGQDEEAAARRFAGQLDLDHRVLRLDDSAATAGVDQMKASMHEPFADFSLLPTLLLSGFARERVTVALSGDGGDELFFGYERPRSLLRDGGFFRRSLGVRRLAWGLGRVGERLGLGRRRSDAILFPSMGDYYHSVNSRLDAPALARLAPDLPPPSPPPFYESGPWQDAGPGDPRRQADFSRWAEFHGQLQRCLKKVDLASMHHSLEVRVPLLDTEILDLSLRIDPMAHMAGGERKHVLRRALGRRLPGAEQQSVKR